MTGFGKGEADSENWKVTVMMRSLNGKGLDMSIRIPPFIVPIELEIKNEIKRKLKRGNITVFVDVDQKLVKPPVDVEKLKSNVKMLKKLVKELNLQPSDDKVLDYAWRYSEKAEIEIDEELRSVVLEALRKALDDLIESRRKEGEALKKDLHERVNKIEEIVNILDKNKELIKEKIKNRVLERAKALNLSEEHPTVLNELMFLLEKYDVNEEVQRLKIHIERFKKLLEADGEVGKKLEFLAQEMHREITTLGNKIPDFSEYTVEIKSEIDKIKQQAANVE
ncbi:MAG TPA: YicC family protein [Aquificaceae bacterium]|nr:YicC family protein [Aquificaceae bacterium]HIQ48199.1 YicC family protein [Aquifex aeolicus]